MKEPSEEIRKQLHDIRNLLGGLDLRVTDLAEQISEVRIALGDKIERLEEKSLANSFLLGEARRDISKCLGKHTGSPKPSKPES